MMIPLDRIDNPRNDAAIRRLREPQEWWDAQRGTRRRVHDEPALHVPSGGGPRGEGMSGKTALCIFFTVIGGLAWILI